jgi:hypothetical protein
MPSDPVDAARRFVEEHFPEATAALVGGSVIRGEGTSTSDLDIVVISRREEAPLRASYLFEGWPVEVFVHTEESLPRWIAKDGERLRPSMAMMVAEGVPVRGDEALVRQMKEIARALLDRGPDPLSAEALENWRYSLTDLLDDFLGAEDPDEGMFVANDLAVEIANLSLLMQGRWLGSGKWVPRAMKRSDPALAARLTDALATYYRTTDKRPLAALAEETLSRAGGRLFEGYYRPAPRGS